MFCTIWYHLQVKSTLAGVSLLVKLQANKSSTPPWVFFMFFFSYSKSFILLKEDDLLLFFDKLLHMLTNL